MKRLRILLLLSALASKTIAQTDTISIGCNKTISLVFSHLISNADRGSRDLLLQKTRGAENILQLKAAKENFPETNLSVITADGRLWTFIVRYDANPVRLRIDTDSAGSIFETIARQPPTIGGIRDNKYEISLRLSGMYIEDQTFYYQLTLQNHSNIGYDIDQLRFYIRDKKQHKRTATQTLEQTPLFIYGNNQYIPAQTKQTLVVALPKFTIPDKKLCFITIMEKNGGRHLRLKIHNHQLIRARLL